MTWIFDSVPPASAPKHAEQESACPECCGEGFIESIGGPGFFSDRDEAWMPSCEVEPCEACRGTGVQERDEPADTTNSKPHHSTEGHVEATEDAASVLPF